jgi:hypothetical protein
MRQFYWTKVPIPKIKDTVWDVNANPAQLIAITSPAVVNDTNERPSSPISRRVPSIILNKDDLEKLFCAKKTARGVLTHHSLSNRHAYIILIIY